MPDPNQWLDADAVRFVERITRPLGGGNYHPEPTPEADAERSIAVGLVLFLAVIVAVGIAAACGLQLHRPFVN